MTKYILREVISHAAIGAAVFTFVIFMQRVGLLLELVVRNSAPLPSVFEIFAYTVPTALIITVPMGVLVGILIGLSRLAADSEITAMRSVGMGAWHFVRILSIFVVAAWLFALFNNVIVAPRAAAALSSLQDRLKTSQASFEIQPRVFYEDFKNYVVYVQDATNGDGAALWKGVFLADVNTPGSPKITLAREGYIVAEGPDNLRLHLTDGAQHETAPKKPEEYAISHFAESDIPIALPPSEQVELTSRHPSEVPTSQLLATARAQKEPKRIRAYEIEFHRRFAFPTACLVLSLVGIPLGLSSRKGGKSTGFVLTILLVFIYYITFLAGMSLARQGKVPPALGMWMGNAIFLLGGLVLLWRVDRMPIEIGSVRNLWAGLRSGVRSGGRALGSVTLRGRSHAEMHLRRTRVFGTRFPLILDELILRNFFLYLGLILSSFLVLLLIFTFFELLKDIMKNRVSMLVVGEYLLNLIPYLIYNISPLAVLLAVLVTFGLLERTNQVTAMKATGISVYRIASPVLVIGFVIAAALFAFDQWYLPEANRRQDALRNTIKGKPPQTYLRPDRKWIFGQQSTVFYYEFFEPGQNVFGNLSIFQFNPKTFAITRRVAAQRAQWDPALQKWIFANGWERQFGPEGVSAYRTFDVATFPELATEQPAYFKKEVKQSSEMNYAELRRYIADLRQSGFDTTRLRVQLQKKFAYPLIAFVMAVLAVPFSLSAGRKGALAGVATAIAIGVVYWLTSGLFEAMGNANQLPAFLAAWAPDFIFGFLGGYMVLKVPT